MLPPQLRFDRLQFFAGFGPAALGGQVAVAAEVLADGFQPCVGGRGGGVAGAAGTSGALARLISAVTTGPEWGQAFSYDGWGNMTAQTVTRGTAPNWTLGYDPATNRISTPGYGYDASGNLTAAPWGSFSYDAENRLAWATFAGPQQQYGYAPGTGGC